MKQPSKETLIRYFRGECEPHEIELVALYLSMDLDKELVIDCLKQVWLNWDDNFDLEISDTQIANFKENFYTQNNKLNLLPVETKSIGYKIHFSAWVKIAAVLILISASFFIYKNWYNTNKEDIVVNNLEVKPGKDKALLTLADGRLISLADAPNGELIENDELNVRKTADGEIAYSQHNNKLGHTTAINTIATPRGGKYRVILPDGTKVWLNAASSLSYPIKFTDDERRVKMTGEVYFEVAPLLLSKSNNKVPFLVETDKQVIEVLGTHFNVNAYEDEPILKTTLVEGKVKIVSKNGQSAFLRPGQIAIVATDIKVKEADVEQELAWKNGDFIFKGETLESALRQISRWYDVVIECPPHIGKLRFNGIISRSQPLAMIIETIRLTKKAKVTLNGRRLIVTD